MSGVRSARELKGRVRICLSPLRGWFHFRSLPTAYAVGCILSPLRGWDRRGIRSDKSAGLCEDPLRSGALAEGFLDYLGFGLVGGYLLILQGVCRSGVWGWFRDFSTFG